MLTGTKASRGYPIQWQHEAINGSLRTKMTRSGLELEDDIGGRVFARLVWLWRGETRAVNRG